MQPIGVVEISYPAPKAPKYAQWLVGAMPDTNVLCVVPNAPAVHVTTDNMVTVMVVYSDKTGGWAVATHPLLPQLPQQPTPGPSSATAPLALVGSTCHIHDILSTTPALRAHLHS